ncbi:hypothetical protein [Nocardioides nanhaiensis]|uniref:Uncharacterized protein n=1 Tax=Nocardioides nanhaiensis TaxID=1476871 RepID=A0ABP8VQG4_9ACTN
MLPGPRPPVLVLVLVALVLALGLGAAPAGAGAPAVSAARATSADRAADQLVVAVNRKRVAAAKKVAAPGVVATLMTHRRAGLRFGGREVNPCTGTGTQRSCTALVYRGSALRGYLQATATRAGGGWTITRATVTLF